jgi:hypothetical protein
MSFPDIPVRAGNFLIRYPTKQSPYLFLALSTRGENSAFVNSLLETEKTRSALLQAVEAARLKGVEAWTNDAKESNTAIKVEIELAFPEETASRTELGGAIIAGRFFPVEVTDEEIATLKESGEDEVSSMDALATAFTTLAMSKAGLAQ